MFKLVAWNPELDLNEFYRKAKDRGYENNSSQKLMIDTFNKEREYKAWILYHNEDPCGSVVCHSLDILGPNAYRMCARTCMFAEYSMRGLYTRTSLIKEFQHVAPQFYMPANIEWAGLDKDFYISSNNSKVASQRLVHNMWCPEMEKLGLLSKHCELEYRGHLQTFWKLNVDKFLTELDKYPRWV